MRERGPLGVPAESAPLHGRRVLVVDDDEDVRLYLLTVLADAGAMILEAGDGEEAVTVAGDEHPDLITLDLAMPGTDGIEAFCRLRAEPATEEIPVCIVTGHSEFRQLIYDRPCRPPDGFMRKPVDPKDLVLTVRRILNLVEKRRQRAGAS